MNLDQILQLITVAGPQIVGLIVSLRGQDGTVTTVAYLDSSKSQFEANNAQITDWLSKNPPPA